MRFFRPTKNAIAISIAAWPLFFLLLLPVLALIFAGTPSQLISGLKNPLVWPALRLSLFTSFIATLISLLLGTPAAWWIARRATPKMRSVIESFVALPIVLPPAVVGLALLLSLGPHGLLGQWLAKIGITLPFSTAAVILAQLIVSAPLYIQAASSAFLRLDDELIIVARSLGASSMRTFLSVAVPAVFPSLLGGILVAWARALGEFGATLLFAGNLPGQTQTLPLAIYTAFESDLNAARALSVLLGLLAIFILIALRFVVPKDLRSDIRHRG